MKRPQGKWAMDYEACVNCGTTRRRHMGKGKCYRCYFLRYAAENLETVKGYKRKWYSKAGGKVWARINREQRNYGGMREPALRRDNYTCQRCGNTKKLTVHHKDGNGRGSATPNNQIDNLETVCRGCHINIHRAQLLAAKQRKEG